VISDLDDNPHFFEHLTDALDESQIIHNDIFDIKLLPGIDQMPLLPSQDDFFFENQARLQFHDLEKMPSEDEAMTLQHDCMWSGTCIDKNHPMKKKLTSFDFSMTSYWMSSGEFFFK
jgi:hypothetical protein